MKKILFLLMMLMSTNLFAESIYIGDGWTLSYSSVPRKASMVSKNSASGGGNFAIIWVKKVPGLSGIYALNNDERLIRVNSVSVDGVDLDFSERCSYGMKCISDNKVVIKFSKNDIQRIMAGRELKVVYQTEKVNNGTVYIARIPLNGSSKAVYRLLDVIKRMY